MRKTKLAMLQSVVALILCAAMLVGTTFAWFTDEVTSAVNKIQAGTLDVDLVDAAGNSLEGTSLTFMDVTGNTDILWEPGCTFKTQGFRVANRGSLALEYTMYINGLLGDSKLLEVIRFSVQDADGYTVDIDTFEGQLSARASSDVFYLVGHMDENAGNEYMNLTLTGIGITVYATQAMEENDSFGPEYDKDAFFPGLDAPILGSVNITTENDLLTADAYIDVEGAKVTIPAGTRVKPSTTTLKLRVKLMDETTSDVKLSDNQVLQPMDVTVEGVSDDNQVPLTVELYEIAPVGLNMGSIALHHVHKGVTAPMTRVAADAAFTADNQYRYDPATGDLALHMATFSEVAVVADTENAWEGKLDYTWYDASKTELTIANADQLAALGAIVGGMKKVTGRGEKNYTYSEEVIQDSFAGKTIKLVADINLGDDEKNNVEGKIFYPIGYWNNEGTYERKPLEERTTAVSSGFYAFSGTFDGNGNTISNFYQNTWEMKGDHDWYDVVKDQYFRDGFGLFGKVYGGTVKNLIVDNYSCDSEIGTTGVIAAYADSKNGQPAVFENITITNCNPRVYNIGNGGIVGCAGWYSRNDTELKSDTYENAVTFRNITVDQTNKISALWGSWGVSCAGILGQYYPNSACGIKLENCHVAAIIDVNNDVCSNYQYYWYRYAGMFIGTIRANTKDANGYEIADTTGVFAKDCTYTMGNWNEYWYCEIVANSLASYTHDHQFSRLDNITDISEIQNADGTWKKEGHFALLSADRKSVECYHIFKNSEGNLYQHFHDKADESNPNIYETFDLNGDGELNDLKEDRQRYFIPFNQLMTGLDMGIKAHTEFEGITEKKDGTVESKKKFESIGVTNIDENATVTLDKLFSSQYDASVISMPTVQVYVSPMGYGSTVSAKYNQNVNDWTQSTLTFSGKGSAKIVITDYFYCTSTTMYVTVGDTVTAYDKFETKFTGDFLYRVGNLNTVALGSLFEAKDGVNIGDVSVTVDALSGTAASGTYTANTTDWTKGTIQFSGTGIVKVTITDNSYCTPTELYLEVVDAVNATTATNATANNVVLLNDISSGFTVSGRYAVYGNGFTLNYTGNGQYLNNGLKQGVVTVSENGTLDNLRIKASIYPAAYLYYEEVQKGPSSVEGTKTRYHYQLSAVAASGNATISNCYIYGGRNNIFVNTGDVTIKDSVLECGTLANVQIQSNANHTVTFDNVTTIQHRVNATIGDTAQVMMGAGVIVGPETNDNPAIVLNNSFKQYNWVNASDKTAVTNSTAQTIIQTALNATAFNHTVNGETASNLGIIYLNEYDTRITNNTELPYGAESVSMMGESGKVYSLKGATANQIYSDYENADRATVNGLYQPQFKYDNTLGDQYIAKTDDGDEFCYREGDTIYVLFPSGDTKELDLAKFVNIAKYTGQNLDLTITCKDENGNAVTVTGGKVSLSAAGEYTVTYTVTDTLFYDKDGNAVPGSEKYSWNITVNVALKDSAVQDARFEFDATKQKMGYYKPTRGDVKQYLPFLAGLKIYDYNGQTSYLRFDGDADFNKIASITITGYTSKEAYIEVKLTDGGVINTKFLARADSGGGSTYTGKIKTSNNTVYFVTDSGTSNKEATTTAAYWYVDYYKFTGNNGVTIQSAQQTFSSTGKSASTPSGNFSTTIKYTVTYDANSGNCGQAVGYATSASTAVTLPTATRFGYTFLGWYTAASGGDRIGAAGESYNPTGDITLYAQWGAPCTVTYNANGGSCGTTSEKFDGKTLILPEATRDGYTFLGWYTAASGGTRIGGAGDSYTPNANITLYAQWGVPCTVTYNANGGSCDITSELYDGDLKLPTPTRTGYSFKGWYTATSGGTKIGDAGAPYTPSANITLYAQWQISSYTITVTTTNATVKVNGTRVNHNGTVSIQYGAQVTVEVTYSESDDRSTTITGTDGTTYTSPFNMPAQDVTINATSSGCVTPDTLITLADGTQVRVDSLTGNEELLVWNMETGKLDKAPILFVDSDPETEYEIIHLYFSDGTDVKVISEHGFWDYDLNKYVYLDRNAADYIGHTFAKQNGDILEKVELVDVVIEREVTTAWSPVTAGHLCYFVNGMLSMPGGVGGLFNIFEVNAETMTYDYEQMAKDIETYGLYTYEELNAICPLSEEMFNAAGGAYLKVSIGKGNLTEAELIAMILRYSKYF